MPYDYYGNWYAGGHGSYGGYGSPSYYGGYGPAYGPGFGPRYPRARRGRYGATPATRAREDYHPLQESYEAWTYNDDEIEYMVRDNLRTDPRIPDGEIIEVAVVDAVVLLSGTVHSQRAKLVAHAVAFWTPGVADVIDELQVAHPRQHRERTGGRQPGPPGQA